MMLRSETISPTYSNSRVTAAIGEPFYKLCSLAIINTSMTNAANAADPGPIRVSANVSGLSQASASNSTITTANRILAVILPIFIICFLRTFPLSEG